MTGVLLLDMFFTAADLARLRRCLTDTARLAGLAGLAEPRRGEFVLAVHEVTGNAVQHGGGRGLWLARELSDRLDIADGEAGAIVTLEFDLAVTRRDTPGLASAAAPGGPARR